MKNKTLLSVYVAVFFISTSSFAQMFCIVVNGGCKDGASGKLYVQEGNQLVDPETKRFYMEAPSVPVTGPVIIRPRPEPQTGIPINPTTGRPYPIVTRNIGPVDEPATAPPPPGVSGREVPNGQFQPHPGQQNPGPQPSAIDPRTGQFYPGVAGGIINPRNGQFYPDVGAGYINPATGRFMPKQ